MRSSHICEQLSAKEVKDFNSVFLSKIDLLPIYVLVQAVVVGNQLIESLLLQPSMNIQVLKAWLKEKLSLFFWWNYDANVNRDRKVTAPGLAEAQEG